MNNNRQPVMIVVDQGLQERFLALLPIIEKHARIRFCQERCAARKADAVAEVIALCWLWFLRLAMQGRDASNFPGTLASYAARAVRSGRRLVGQERARETLSPLAQRRRDFHVSRLQDARCQDDNLVADAFRDNTQTPVPDQVAFRCDWPDWLLTRTDRDRRIIASLALNERTKDISQKFGLTAGRISQLRREYRADWNSFCEPSAADLA